VTSRRRLALDQWRRRAADDRCRKRNV